MKIAALYSKSSAQVLVCGISPTSPTQKPTRRLGALLEVNNGPRCLSGDAIMFWSGTLMSILCVELRDYKVMPTITGVAAHLWEPQRRRERGDESLFRQQTTLFLELNRPNVGTCRFGRMGPRTLISIIKSNPQMKRRVGVGGGGWISGRC